MANNSSGARSVLYGKTIDHVLEQTVVLSDGSIAHFREIAARLKSRTRRHARSRVLSDRAAPRVASTPPKSTAAIRRCCAASAATTSTSSPIPSKPVNLAKIMVGSEGTLGVVLEAKLQSGAAAESQGRDGDRLRGTAGSARGRAGRF